LNLINNARDAFTDEPKTNTDEDSPHIIVRTSAQKNGSRKSVKIDVIDSGTGISQELMPKIYDPFFTTKDPDKGTGLGLAISKSIVEAFHGVIDIKSTQGKGTTVTITLPVNGQEEEKSDGE